MDIRHPAWMAIAENELGEEEISGPEANPRIVEYDAATTLKATSDEVPWCSSFANWCIKQARLLDSSINRETRSAAAASWRQWGKELEFGCYGCIVVFDRVGGNHVAFYLSEDDTGVTVLGGNQGDAVSKAHFSWSAVTNFRWPTSWDIPTQ
jgi:uncharacterized protein (TIGR02594 family)